MSSVSVEPYLRLEELSNCSAGQLVLNVPDNVLGLVVQRQSESAGSSGGMIVLKPNSSNESVDVSYRVYSSPRPVLIDQRAFSFKVDERPEIGTSLAEANGALILYRDSWLMRVSVNQNKKLYSIDDGSFLPTDPPLTDMVAFPGWELYIATSSKSALATDRKRIARWMARPITYHAHHS